MTQRYSTGRQERFVRRYDYEDGTVVAADLGADDERVAVDVVDGTAIVVVEEDDDAAEEEFEFELPGPAASVDTQNGVLTIRINQ